MYGEQTILIEEMNTQVGGKKLTPPKSDNLTPDNLTPKKWTK